MNLGLCIANLLRRYPAVDVPGIGVFKKTHAPASYDGGLSAFLPPANHIELVEDHPDGFPITAYLQAQQQVDESAATLMLEKAVKATMESISRRGEALLEGLGYLLADGASFVFKPIEIDGLHWEPIGVQPLAVPDDPAVSDESDHAAAEIADTEAVADGHPRSRRSVRWIVAAAVLLVLLAAAGAVWYVQPTWFDRAAIAELFTRMGEVTREADHQEPPAEVAPLVAAEADSLTDDTAHLAVLADGPISAGDIPVDSVSAADTVAVRPSVTYEIIVGSFATMKQATKFVAEMKAKGYDLQAIDSRMPGNRKKISWGSFATEEEAYRELARVQKNFEPGAWIAKVAHD